MNSIKVGHNPTANMLPMFFYLDKNNPIFNLVTDVPTGHNRLLAEGKIDMAPISAFSYGEHWQDYNILSDLSISAKGKVGSIFLFSKYKIEELNNKRIALTNMSATSVNLLKVIFNEFYKISPEYTVTEPNLQRMLQEYDAALLIADDAILGLSQNNYHHVYDLGEEWLKQTGLPMTFSVWAVPKGVVTKNRELVARVHDMLSTAKVEALANIEAIIKKCILNIGRDFSFWENYFANFRYDFGEDLQEGLQRYYGLCYKHGLLKTIPQLNII